MKDLANSISKGKNLEMVLPKYGQGMMSVYYKYAAVRLAMNYYTYSEMLGERLDDENKDFIGKSYLSFNEILNEILEGNVVGEKLENAIYKIDSIRNDIIKTMKGLTSLVDIFNIYEYALNRVEYRYKDSSHITMKNDEEFTSSLMQYILSSKDKTVINANITETVRQLPLRMTKARFFELLQEGLKVYRDSEKSSVDDFIYMISSSSMVYIDDYTKEISDDINSILRDFENTDFSNIDEELYNSLYEKLKFGIDYVQCSVDKYMLFTELVNDAYAMLLAAPYADDTDCKEKQALIKIVEAKDDGSAEDALVMLEGSQERLNSIYTQAEYAIDEVLGKYMDIAESIMLGAMYNSLKRISILESGSYFVEFDGKRNTEIAGEAYVLEKFEQLSNSLKEFFASHNKLINRAVMANIIACLPVFFNNVEEIQNYVYNSINGCSDLAEKKACVEIFTTMMEEDGFDVVSR